MPSSSAARTPTVADASSDSDRKIDFMFIACSDLDMTFEGCVAVKDEDNVEMWIAGP